MKNIGLVAVFLLVAKIGYVMHMSNGTVRLGVYYINDGKQIVKWVFQTSDNPNAIAQSKKDIKALCKDVHNLPVDGEPYDRDPNDPVDGIVKGEIIQCE